MHSRRGFSKLFVLGSAVSLIPEFPWRSTLLAEVRQVGANESGSLKIRLSDYPVLASDFGSVRIGTSTLVNNSPSGLFFPLLIHRAPNRVFHALSAECTHASGVIQTFNSSTKTFRCTRLPTAQHGSQFAIDGQRISGPASAALRNYALDFDGVDVLTIQLPDHAFAVDARIIEAPGKARISLEFLGFANLEYEVGYRPNMESSWQKIPFAVTLDGPANSTVISGDDDFRKIYIDRVAAVGFYQVGVRTKQV